MMGFARLLAPWPAVHRLLKLSLAGLDQLLVTGRWKALLAMLLGLIISWHVYVPLHELLHVFACWLTGGTVEALAVKPRYGAFLFERLFPFVIEDSAYAGQLRSFHVPHMWAYLFVDLLPYIPSLFGLALLQRAAARKRPWAFSACAILTFAPLMGIPGDYYEAASLLVRRAAQLFDAAPMPGQLVSDDVFRLLTQQLHAGEWTAFSILLVGTSMGLAVYLVMITLALETVIAEWFRPRHS